MRLSINILKKKKKKSHRLPNLITSTIKKYKIKKLTIKFTASFVGNKVRKFHFPLTLR